jgi:hypothetical protein
MTHILGLGFGLGLGLGIGFGLGFGLGLAFGLGLGFGLGTANVEVLPRLISLLDSVTTRNCMLNDIV